MAVPLWSWILFVDLDAVIVLLGSAIIFISAARTYDRMRSRGMSVWAAALGATAVGILMGIGGWLLVVAWWLVRFPIRWLPRLYRITFSN